jgi:rhamnose utilization protein RhaD (predicted bifunctional aldolase and dehydrogenase)
MKPDAKTPVLATSVKEFCTTIAADRLLVQGAGGNVSWKDGNVLWIKASGQWLKHSTEQEIFVAVDLQNLRHHLEQANYSVTPKLVEPSLLRPSIETLLHALMVHKVVVHLHPVELLAILVREDPESELRKLLGTTVNWIFVNYHKPGKELASAVAAKLSNRVSCDVVFLQNHGVVIGGETIAQVMSILAALKQATQSKVHVQSATAEIEVGPLDSALLKIGYRRTQDTELNALAKSPELAARLTVDWALYPDHVVFLGQAARTDLMSLLANHTSASIERPPFVFSIDDGVFESTALSKEQRAQLLCYYDVLVRQSTTGKLVSLTDQQVSELIDWDAEKYRASLSKSVAG